MEAKEDVGEEDVGEGAWEGIGVGLNIEDTLC